MKWQMKCKKSLEGQTQKQANMLWRDGLGKGTANGPRDKQKRQEYLQQKTEKFHLFSSPDAPINQRQKRDRQMEKKIM